MSQLTHLVVGSDSVFGRALVKRLHETGTVVIGTTRRRELVNESNVYLDLSEDLKTWTPPCQFDVAILCAGITKTEDCRRNPELSDRVNVSGISSLAEMLISNGTFVIFPSTNQVFDGSQAHRSASDPVCPVTRYGRQKVETEKNLLRFDKSVSVIRFAKILESNPPLLAGWKADLEKGRAIRPYSDMVLAPLPLEFCVDVVSRLAKVRVPGIMQASAAEDVSYAHVARHIAERVGAANRLIEPVLSHSDGTRLEPTPAHTTLDSAGLQKEIGLWAPDVWTTLDSSLSL